MAKSPSPRRTRRKAEPATPSGAAGTAAAARTAGPAVPDHNRSTRSTASRSGNTTVSLAEIAEAAQVSRMTASRVLRGAEGYSDATRDKVLAVAERLGYVPNRIAAALGSDSANSLVGIGLPTLSRDLYSQLLEGLESKLSSVGYQPMVGVVGYDDEAEAQWLQSALAWRPCGLIVAGRHRSTAQRKVLRGLSVPVIEIWNLQTEGPRQHKSDPLRVGFDHVEAGRQMGRYLQSRYRGRVGYVGVRNGAVALGTDRLRGFVQGFLGDEVASGLSAAWHTTASQARLSDLESQGVLTTLFLHDRSSFYAGFYGTEQILSANPSIRVLYYLDDAMAVGGLMWCQQKGLKVPGDVAIAGFGGLDIGSVLPARLTTTVAHRLKIGKLAAESLVKCIGGDTVPASQDVGFEVVKGETA